jgi:hypothetical protein
LRRQLSEHIASSGDARIFAKRHPCPALSEARAAIGFADLDEEATTQTRNALTPAAPILMEGSAVAAAQTAAPPAARAVLNVCATPREPTFVAAALTY